MKKLLLMTVVVLALMLAAAGMASANGGPHGDYTATTDACAGCHRAHTASGPNLLMQTSTYDLCVSCHGGTATGANTNVDDGYYLVTRDDPPGGDWNHGSGNTYSGVDGALLGGGFVNYNAITVTSSHVPSGTTAFAWGNGVARGITATLTAGNLTCASCHDPHGNTNYRMINASLNGASPTPAQVDEDDTAFCPSGICKDYDDEQWDTGMSSICAACHSAYHVTQVGSGSITQTSKTAALYGNDTSTWAHRIDMAYNYGLNDNPETIGYTDTLGSNVKVPLAVSGVISSTNNLVVCMTCHLPHGTSATVSALAQGPNTGGSDLLRLDNRGVCEACHQK